MRCDEVSPHCHELGPPAAASDWHSLPSLCAPTSLAPDLPAHHVVRAVQCCCRRPSSPSCQRSTGRGWAHDKEHSNACASLSLCSCGGHSVMVYQSIQKRSTREAHHTVAPSHSWNVTCHWRQRLLPMCHSLLTNPAFCCPLLLLPRLTGWHQAPRRDPRRHRCRCLPILCSCRRAPPSPLPPRLSCRALLHTRNRSSWSSGHAVFCCLVEHIKRLFQSRNASCGRAHSAACKHSPE